jgi:hypothetical protein
MKKISLLILLFAFSALYICAQKQQPVTPQLPVDSITHKITYEAVTDVKDAKADVLYKRAMAWFKSYYPNPTEVIRENDSLKFKITGKPRFKIYNPADKTGLKTDAGLVQYTITVACKDGRFKYELTDFNHKENSYYACEKWFDSKNQYYSPAMADYLAQIDTYSKATIKSLLEGVTKEKAVKDKDNW